MLDLKKVADLMVPLKDYPHVPYWSTLSKAMASIKEAAIKSEGDFEPRSVLVFDEKYHPMGILTLRDIIKSLTLRSLQETVGKRQSGSNSDSAFPGPKVDFYGPAAEVASQVPVIEVMSPSQIMVGARVSLAEALFLMIKNDVGRLPVMRERKVVGIIRLSDLFREISACVLSDQKQTQTRPIGVR